MIYASYDDERPERTFTTGPEHYGIRPGRWEIDGEWYLTAGAAMKELHIPQSKKERFFQLVKDKKVRTKQLPQPYQKRMFTVYSAEDLGIEEPFDGKERVW